MFDKERVRIVTTFPNSFLKKQVSEATFKTRLEESFEAALEDHKQNYKVIALCDSELLSYYEPTHASLIEENPNLSMGHGRRQVIQAAYEELYKRDNRLSNSAILWREPEKNLAKFTEQLLSPVLEGNADLTIMNREKLDSYPTFFKFWEKVGSRYCSKIFGIDADYFSGPRGMNLKAAPCFYSYLPKVLGLPDRHDSIFCPVLDCIKAGFKILGVQIPFEYPKNQRDAEENDPRTMEKRMQVMEQLFNALDTYKLYMG